MNIKRFVSVILGIVALTITLVGLRSTNIALANPPPPSSGCYSDIHGLIVCPGVQSIVSGTCTSPSPGASSSVAVNYICATPQAVTTGQCTSPAPNGAGGIKIDLITPCPLITGGGGPGPTNTPYLVVVQSYTPKHLYELNDTGALGPYSNCPATFADSGSSAVALTTPNPAPSISCGSAPLDSSNQGSVEFDGSAAGDYITIPNGVIPSSSPSPAAYSIVMSMQYSASTGTTPNLLVYDLSNHGNLGCSSSGAINIYNGSSFNSNVANACTGPPVLVGVTFSAPNKTILWVNGAPATFASAALGNQSAGGELGGNSSCSCSFGGHINNFWILTSVLAQSDWDKLYYAFRCGSKAAGTC
jgi:hypothetical protein